VNALKGFPLYGAMFFRPSSIVKTAPHFGHFTFVSLLTIPQPKVNTAKTANVKNMLTSFFTPLHLLSFDIFLSELQWSPGKKSFPQKAYEEGIKS
jgi:hypothetical protein